MKYLLTLLCFSVLLISCHEDNDEPKKAVRTVMVYMAGENNLTVYSGHHFLRTDLSEMIEGSKQLADNQRLLVFIDSLNSKGSTKMNPYIVEIHGGKATVLKEYENDFYSCDPARFREVLQWMMSTAPAETYGLVLWGHATGWAVSKDTIAEARSRSDYTRAYGADDGDDLSDDGGDEGTKWMNITQMARALEGLPKMEFIFADCCCMMCAEVGYELRNATNYLIGSPAEIPGYGAPYAKLIPTFYSSGEALYRPLLDIYADHYLEEYQTDAYLKGNTVPLSVIDTKNIEQLAQATHDVLAKFEGGYPVYPSYPSLSGCGTCFYWYYNAPVMYDMKSFVHSFVSEADYQAWLKYYERAVPYYRTSLKWETAYRNMENSFDFFDEEQEQGCVSMYIPVRYSNYFSGTFPFNKSINKMGWNRAMEWSRFGWDENSTYY